MDTIKMKDILNTLVGLTINEDIIFDLLKKNKFEISKEDVKMAVIEVTLKDKHYFTGKIMINDFIITCNLDYKQQQFYLKNIK